MNDGNFGKTHTSCLKAESQNGFRIVCFIILTLGIFAVAPTSVTGKHFPFTKFTGHNSSPNISAFSSTSSNAFPAGPQQDVELVNRIWTDVEAREVRGVFRARLGDTVKIENLNGEVISFPYDSLTQGDKDYVDAAVAKFGPTPNSRTWSDTSGNNFRGSFVKLNKSEIEFLLLDDDRRMNIETVFLTEQDIDYLLNKISSEARVPSNRDRSYRVWRFYDANSNALRCIGQYKKVVGKNLVLYQVDTEYRIPIDQLDASEIDYLKQIDPTLRGQIGRRSGEDYVSSPYKSEEEKKRQQTIENGRVRPIWWVSIGLVFLLLLSLIAIRYIYESSAPEWDDN